MSDNSHSSSSAQPSGEWGPCPAGTVGRLVGKLKQRRRMRRIRQVAVVASGLLLLAVAARSLWNPHTSPRELSHADVVKLADQFIRGELDAEQTRRVEDHIRICPQCYHLLQDRQAYKEKHAAQSPDPHREDAKLVARAH